MSKSATSSFTHFFQEQQIFSLAMLRLVGYGLIIMALLDYISLIFPPQFMNPSWEFQTVGGVVERIPIVLLGLVFVFCGERQARKTIEHKLLKFLSWLTLIFAIVLFLCFPLNIVNGFRIYYGNNTKVNAQIAPQIDALNDFQAELKTAESLSEISSILQKQSRKQVSIPSTVNRDELKDSILSTISENQQKIESQVYIIKQNQKKILLKNGVKWNLGLLISGFILVFIWQQTRWSRIPYEVEDN